MSNQNIKAFMQAAADLLESAVKSAKTENPEEYAVLVQCIKAGGMVNITATMAPTTGIAQLGINVIEPSGASHRLMSANLERNAL